jgi:hypothetical protein
MSTQLLLELGIQSRADYFWVGVESTSCLQDTWGFTGLNIIDTKHERWDYTSCQSSWLYLERSKVSTIPDIFNTNPLLSRVLSLTLSNLNITCCLYWRNYAAICILFNWSSLSRRTRPLNWKRVQDPADETTQEDEGWLKRLRQNVL